MKIDKILLTLKTYFIFLIFLSNFCFSQDQQVDLIFNDGDTISGYGFIKKNHNIKFRVSKEDKADTWNFLMVKRIVFYGFNTSKTFEYIKKNSRQKPVLAEVIREGKVTLYEKLKLGNLHLSKMFNTGIDGVKMDVSVRLPNTKSLYVKRENEEIATNLSGNFKKKSLAYFKDCEEITDIFKDKSYLRYRIEDLVIEYNLYCNN